jgi:tetratricopeptide (TPR) repeat protein
MTTLLAEVEALRRSEPTAALARLEQGFAEAARRADAAGRGNLWRLRAHVLRSLRRTREAALAYRRAADWFAKAGDAREQGRCTIGLVDALMYLGRYREARQAAALGRRLLTRAGDRAALGRLLNNEGNLWHRLDLPERALESYREAMRALERAGEAGNARMIGTNVGNCLSLLGRLGEARRHYTAARDAQAADGNANEQLSAEYNLAYLDFLELHHEQALTGLARVRDEAERRGYPSLAALSRLDRAEILLRLGAWEDALTRSRSPARPSRAAAPSACATRPRRPSCSARSRASASATSAPRARRSSARCAPSTPRATWCGSANRCSASPRCGRARATRAPPPR